MGNYSTYCIFRGKNIDNMPSGGRLRNIIVISVVYDLVVSVIWFMVDPPKILTENTMIKNKYYSEFYCKFDQGTLFKWIFAIPKLLFLFWGAYTGFCCSSL